MSAVLQATLGSIIAMLARDEVRDIQTRKNKKGDLEVSFVSAKTEKRETIIIPSTRIADSFTYARIKRASTTKQTRPDSPNIEIDNPRKIDSTVSAISLIADSQFKTDGIFSITINKVAVFESLEAGNLADVQDAIDKMFRGKKIRASEKVRLFMWNGVGATQISITLMVEFAE